MQFDAATGRWLDIVKKDGTLTRRLDLLAKDDSSVGFAADSNGLYLSIHDKGCIRAYDRKSFAQTKEYPLPGAGEIFAIGDGRLLTVTPAALQELSLADGALRTLATGDFTAARGITADRERIYLSLGAPRHQVLVFKRHGVRAMLEKVIGKRGGRALNGWYKPSEGFSNPTGMAVDTQGRLWVVEQSYKPKRVSVWKHGAWQRDFIGDTFYGGGGVINPLDPTKAFYKDMVFKIDLDKGASTLKQIGMALPKNAADYGIAYEQEETGGLHRLYAGA